MQTLTHYALLAQLFDYPAADYPGRVRLVRELLGDRYPLAAAELDPFARALPAAGELFTPAALNEIQELFTRSFDVQPITTLSVGYLLFGDDYKRAELMVNLGREQRAAGVAGGSELPDHLPNVLRLIAVWSDGELVAELVSEILRPALERMIAEFDNARMAQRDQLYLRHFRTVITAPAERSALFRAPLTAVLEVLKADFELGAWQPPQNNNDFLRSVVSELELEDGASRLVQLRNRP